MLLPSGEELANQLLTKSGPIYRAMYLPEVCDFPFGMAWPTTISYADLYSSIWGLKNGYINFLTILSTLKPQLTGWLCAMNKNPDNFATASLPFLSIHNRGYPSLNTAEFPETVLDTRAFSPMLEMVNGYIWRLTSNTAMTTGSKEAQKVFLTFVECGKTAITADSYFGEVIPGRLCANFAYHFVVVARWPMRINPLVELILPLFVLERGLDFEPMMIGLYSDHHPQLHLITKDAQSTEDHRRQTSKHSYVQLEETPASPAAIQPAAVITAPPVTQGPIFPPSVVT
jgi:hypothetical protein